MTLHASAPLSELVCIVDLQLPIHNQGCGEQHGFWARPSCECGAVCPAGQQVGGNCLPRTFFYSDCCRPTDNMLSLLLRTVYSQRIAVK